PAQAVGDVESARERGLWRYDCELVAADARARVYAARARLYDVGDATQSLVARLVSVRVVDTLEVVNVNQEQAERVAVAFGARHLALQLALEASAVREYRQMIRDRRLLA